MSAMRASSGMGETLFDRVPWIYAFCREHLFRDDTERIVAHLWPSGIPPAGATVVELGCGPGFYARRLAAHDRAVVASGLDRSPAQVAEARQRAEREGLGNCRFELGDVAAMPYRDQSIDALVAARLFVLVEDREQVLGEMHRVLRPGGRAFIAEPRHALYARLTLGLMRLADRLGGPRINPGADQGEERIDVLDGAEFAALVASQPWRSVAHWADASYRYAVVQKESVT